MALRNLKSWSQYSKRWQKARLKEGLNPRRWNRYRQLSEKTRRKVDPYEYAKGVSVKQQTRNQLLDALAVRVKQIADKYTKRNFEHKKFKPASLTVIRRRLARLDTETLRKMNRMNDDKLYDFIVNQNRKFIEDDELGISPLFYHAGGTE